MTSLQILNAHRQINDFVDYVDSFYGLNDPIYPMTYKDTGLPLTKVDILGATEKYLSMCSEPLLPNCTWGDGDSLDRERVRDILVIKYGYDKTFYGGSVLWEDFQNEL